MSQRSASNSPLAKWRNDLVAAGLAGRKAYRDERSKLHPDHAALEAAYQQADAEVERQVKAIRAENAKQRRKRCSPDESAKLAVAKEARKDIASKLKATRKEIAVDARLNKVSKSVCEALEATAEAEANRAGLYQATKRTIRQAVFKSFASAKVDPRFTKWDGTGLLACQIQAQESILKRAGLCTYAAITLGQYSDLVTIERRGRDDQFAIVSVRLAGFGRNTRHIRCPVKWSREWPADAVLKWVKLSCRRQGRRLRYYVNFTLTSKNGWIDQAGDGTLAINLGHRRLDRVGVRGLYWVGNRRLTMDQFPEHIRQCVRLHDDGLEGELVIPEQSRLSTAGSMAYYAKYVDLQSIRDQRFTAIKQQLGEYLSATCPDWATPLKQFLDDCGKVAGKKDRPVGSKDRLLALTAGWQQHAGDGDIWTALAEWRNKELHLESWQSNQRTRYSNWRADLYQAFWAVMRRVYGTLLCCKANLAEMQRKPEPDSNEFNVHPWRNLVSPGMILSRSKLEPVRIESGNLTRTCHLCSEVCDWDQATRLVHTCEHCGMMWDQDANHCRNLLAHARGELMV